MRGKSVSQLILIFLILSYWLFAWNLEQIDYQQNPPQSLVNIANIYPLFGIIIPRLTFVLELFSPRVLRHFIPIIVGWWLAREAVLRFLLSFYDLTDRESATSLLHRLISDSPGRVPPFQLRPELFNDLRSAEPFIKIGGPCRISIDVGHALVTERNGRFFWKAGTFLAHPSTPFTLEPWSILAMA